MTKLIDIPKITDTRGNLSVIENETIPYPVKRVYYLYDVPSDSFRGGHSHIAQSEFLIALSGSFNVIVDNGQKRESITLNKPNKGLLIEPGIWRELENFSSGSVCLVLASDTFSEEDYIRSYETFKKMQKK